MANQPRSPARSSSVHEATMRFGRGETMRLRKLYLAPVDEGIYYHHWSNSQQTIMGGETVKFSNPYSESEPPRHGLKFTSGPGGAKPSCSGIPVAAESEAGAANWHGECTFSTPGTYTFICTVHPTEMKGTIIVKNAGEPVASSEAATAVT